MIIITGFAILSMNNLFIQIIISSVQSMNAKPTQAAESISKNRTTVWQKSYKSIFWYTQWFKEALKPFVRMFYFLMLFMDHGQTVYYALHKLSIVTGSHITSPWELFCKSATEA